MVDRPRGCNATPARGCGVREQVPGTRKLAHLGGDELGKRELATAVNQGLPTEQRAKVGKVVCPEHF